MTPRHPKQEDKIDTKETPYAKHARQERKQILELLLETSAVSELDPRSPEGKIVHEALDLWATRTYAISLRGALATVCRTHESCAKIMVECRKILKRAWRQADVKIA